jgi:MFS superfamily sulfate permease-like transporter
MAGQGWLSIVNFSESVMVGFKCGVALFLATQLPSSLASTGMAISGRTRATFSSTCAKPSLHSLLVSPPGSACAREDLSQEQTVALLVVVGRIVASGLLGLDARGVKLLGAVPQGLPDIGLPAIHGPMQTVLPWRSCFLLGAVETAAIGRTFAAKYGGRLTPTRVSALPRPTRRGLGRGFGQRRMSQSLVNEGGARTHLPGGISAESC